MKFGKKVFSYFTLFTCTVETQEHTYDTLIDKDWGIPMVRDQTVPKKLSVWPCDHKLSHMLSLVIKPGPHWQETRGLTTNTFTQFKYSKFVFNTFDIANESVSLLMITFNSLYVVRGGANVYKQIADMFRIFVPVFNNQDHSVITPLLATGSQVCVLTLIFWFCFLSYCCHRLTLQISVVAFNFIKLRQIMMLSGG